LFLWEGVLRNKGFRRKAFAIVIFSVSILLFISCNTKVERANLYDQYRGQFTLIFNGPSTVTYDITFEISYLFLVREDGFSVNLLESPVKINSLKVKGRQLILAERSVPSGKYTLLRVGLKEAKIKVKGRETHLALKTEEANMRIDIDVYDNQNTTLFLNWFSDASYREGYLFEPRFEFRKVLPEVARALLFVTNEGSDNVTVVNRYTGKIIGTVKVGDRPSGIATGLLKTNRRVYVVNSGSNTLSIIDPYNYTVEAEVPIVFGSGPVDVAVAKTSPFRELVIVANYNTDTVSFIDPVRRMETESVRVGSGPISIAVDPPEENIIDSPFLNAQELSIVRDYMHNFLNIYVANRNSNDVSVIRINRVRAKVESVFNIDVGWEPVRLYMDIRRLRLLVANYGSDRISVINVVELMKGNVSGAVTTIKNIGTSVVDVIADPNLDRLYLLREFPPEILVLRTFPVFTYQQASDVFPEVERLLLSGTPSDFLLDPETQILYVVNQQHRRLEIIDKTSLVNKGSTPLGNRPVRMALFYPGYEN
jgi:YVTN family beta-propeller protein